MLIKNRKNFVIVFLLSFFLFNLDLGAEEFDIEAKEILLDKENEIVIGKGSVRVRDSDGKIIYADKITYEKSIEFLLAEGHVKIADNEGNILKTDKATYDKINEKIVNNCSYNNTLRQKQKRGLKNPPRHG